MKAKNDYQDHYEEVNPSILMKNEAVVPEHFFTFHGSQMLNQNNQLPQQNHLIYSEEDAFMSFSELKAQENHKNNLEVSLLKRPINGNNDKVTVSMHIFSNVIEMNSKINENHRTIKETEILEYVFKDNGYLDKPIFYRIRTKLFIKEEPFIVERRYSDFECLGHYFKGHPQYQGLILPKLPDKHSFSSRLNNFLKVDLDFIKKRQKELEQYLQEFVISERFGDDRTLYGFLTFNEKEWKEMKERGMEKGGYWGMISTISPYNLIENYNYMKTYLAIK